MTVAFSAVISLGWLVAQPLTAATVGAWAKPRPNILFIMCDDHAAHAISAYGSRVNQTPQIDRLAREGMRFDRCFAVNSICTPSRATILTGKYSHINGVPVFNRFDGSQPTVAQIPPGRRLPHGHDRQMAPGQRSARASTTGPSSRARALYYDPAFLYDRQGRRIIQGYVTDVITDLAIDFLQNRPKDKPFFLMCHHKAPHRPWEPDAKHRRMFAGRTIPEPPTLCDDYATRADALRECQQTVFQDLTRRDLKLEPPAELERPGARTSGSASNPPRSRSRSTGERQTLTGDALNQWKYQRYLQDYLACVQSVDDNVGPAAGLA